MGTLKITKAVQNAIGEKMGNRVKNIMDNNQGQMLEQLKRVCEISEDNEGDVTATVTMRLSWKEQKFGFSTAIDVSHRETFKDSLPHEEMNPNQPELPLGEDGEATA